MARDDDDEAVSDEPLSKRRKERPDDEEEDRPRKKSAREEDDDEDRPRKAKESRAETDRNDRADKTPKPMPLRLIGAIAAALAWGFLTLYFSCVNTSHAALQEIQYQRDRAKMEEQLRAFGGKLAMGNPIDARGVFYTIVASKVFLLLASAMLIAGGITLLMRKSFGQYIAMGAPVVMFLVEFLSFVLCLILSEGKFMDKFLRPHNVDFFVSSVFSLAIGGCIVFLLLNKDVSKALK